MSWVHRHRVISAAHRGEISFGWLGSVIAIDDFALVFVCLAFVLGVVAGICIAVAYVSHLIFG